MDNKPLLRPYFWGGTLGWGRLTGHEASPDQGAGRMNTSKEQTIEAAQRRTHCTARHQVLQSPVITSRDHMSRSQQIIYL